MTVGEVARTLDRWFPPFLAEPWDNVGLLLGDPDREVGRVMTCLTVTPDSAEEAVREGADLVVSHHPILFRGVKRLTADGPDAPVLRLARGDVVVYSPHTAFDNGAGGINDQIAERLGLEEAAPIRPAGGPGKVKLVVFVPDSDLARVQQAMFEAGAGIIGEYADCSYRSTGTGTFRGSEQSHPAIGQAGRREEVSEQRLEVLVPRRRVASVVRAMVQAHSYEEPAFDIYPLDPSDWRLGSGRWGRLPAESSLAALADLLRRVLPAARVDWVGAADRRCRSVAIACGAGADFLDDAGRLGCDVLVTGEARFHQCLAAQASGLSLLMAGHYATERFALETLAQRIAGEWPNLVVWPSRDEEEPLHSC